MHKVKTKHVAKREVAGLVVRAKHVPNGNTPATSNYKVILAARDDLRLVASVPDIPVVESPRYNAERDEPAFQSAWQQVAEMKAQGKITPIPQVPPGGIRLRGNRAKPSI